VVVVATDPSSINLKVGFEIHQQLATKSKLFCNCRCKEVEKYGLTFIRRLRPTRSELGVYDNTALFEFKKMRTIKYHSAPDASCLVEADEEPPHQVNREALEAALVFSLALCSKVVDEMHVMRKIVIDGSNTSGFQRTMLVATGGYLDVNSRRIGVQTICLEEDAAKLISDDGTIREYGLDRLGVPLVEIALEPIRGEPEEMMQIALTLGRLLRASKRVARGLGSIRQDVNISIDNGAIVEVKGVQQLDQLTKVIKYEMLRQHGLLLISQKLKHDRKPEEIAIGDRIEDVTDIMKKSSSKIIKTLLAENDNLFKAIRIQGFDGILGFEPYPDIRIGKQLSELVGFYDIGGIFHSDELPNYGITKDVVDTVKKRLEIVTNNDAFIIIGGHNDKVKLAIESIIQRLKTSLNGVPAETRSATLEGKTIYSRPRPGAARMYPETDISPIPINKSILDSLADNVPAPWNDVIDTLSKKFNLNKKLAVQIFDSDYLDIFQEIVKSTKIQPTFIASKLTEDIVGLKRRGLDITTLNNDIIFDIFKKLDAGIIAKESITWIFEKLMKKESKTPDEAIAVLGITRISDQELQIKIDDILRENMSIIVDKKMGALGMLMGRSMDILRGKADGQKINSMIKVKLEEILKSDVTTEG